MAKMKSWEELKKIREQSEAGTLLRRTGENPDRTVLSVGMATCGIAAGARNALAALLSAIEKEGAENVSVVTTGCLGLCYAEPVVEVRTPGCPTIRYGRVDAALASRIVSEHVKGGNLIDEAIIGREVTEN